MRVADDCAVFFHFTLMDADGEVLSASSEQAPFAYLHGHGQVLASLERALEGKAAGDALKISLTPEEAYGVPDASNREILPREDFSDDELVVGNRIYIMGEQGPRLATVAGYDEQAVILDTNHELAGKSLRFDIRIVSVRKATIFELSCGHVHALGGPGG